MIKCAFGGGGVCLLVKVEIVVVEWGGGGQSVSSQDISWPCAAYYDVFWPELCLFLVAMYAIDYAYGIWCSFDFVAIKFHVNLFDQIIHILQSCIIGIVQ